jgi:hypothetical protein
MNCLLIALRRGHWNFFCIITNVLCIEKTTERLIVLDVLGEVGKSLETGSIVVLLH